MCCASIPLCWLPSLINKIKTKNLKPIYNVFKGIQYNHRLCMLFFFHVTYRLWLKNILQRGHMRTMTQGDDYAAIYSRFIIWWARRLNEHISFSYMHGRYLIYSRYNGYQEQTHSYVLYKHTTFYCMCTVYTTESIKIMLNIKCHKKRRKKIYIAYCEYFIKCF